MVPPKKRQKVKHTTDDPPPIIIPLPGHVPDTRLTVFFQDFHVHSMVLKMHSAFFRKFMDSPEKIAHRNGCGNGSGLVASDNSSTTVSREDGPTSNSSKWPTLMYNPVSVFKYNWVSDPDEEDEDYDWYLVCADMKNEPYPIPRYKSKGETWAVIHAFETFLLALYGRPYQLADIRHLEIVTRHADYYCALPTVSRSVDGALVNTKDITTQIREEPLLALEVAAKLRNALLFKEAVVWATGPHNKPAYLAIEDRSLKRIVQCAHAEVLQKASIVTQRLLRKLGEENAATGELSTRMTHQCFVGLGQYDNDETDRHTMPYPWYFKTITDFDAPVIHRQTREMREMLANNLTLGKELIAGDEVTHLQDHFLCARISDEDLPWDINEVDW